MISSVVDIFTAINYSKLYCLLGTPCIMSETLLHKFFIEVHVYSYSYSLYTISASDRYIRKTKKLVISFSAHFSHYLFWGCVS